MKHRKLVEIGVCLETNKIRKPPKIKSYWLHWYGVLLTAAITRSQPDLRLTRRVVLVTHRQKPLTSIDIVSDIFSLFLINEAALDREFQWKSSDCALMHLLPALIGNFAV